MANRYWVGGTAAWDGTAGTKWALTSGGAGGQAVPTSADDVFFDAASTGTCTISTGNTGAKSITCTGFTGTITGTAAITVSGNVTLAAGMTYTHTGTVTINATATLTTAGKTFGGLDVNGSGITVTLGDALTASLVRVIQITQGTFDTANFNVTCGNFNSSNSNIRTITLGSSTVACSTINAATTTNLTFNAGTSQINVSNASGNFGGAGLTFYNVTFTSTSISPLPPGMQLYDSTTYNNLTVTAPTSSRLSYFTFLGNITVNGTLTIPNPANATRRYFFTSDAVGTQRTLTCNAVAALADVDFRDIKFAGNCVSGGNLTGTRLGDCGGNSAITFTAAANKYWNLAAGGNWSGTAWATSSGGTPDINNFPLPQDTCYIESTGLNSGATISLESTWNIGTLDMSARTANTMTLNLATGSSSPVYYGNFTAGTGCTFTSTLSGTNLTTAGRSSQSITSAGVSFANARININSASGTVTFADNITADTLTLSQGTMSLGSSVVTCVSFNSNNSNTRTIAFGTGNITVTGTGGVWTTSTVTNLTVTGTPVVNVTNSTATATTVATGSLSEANAISFNFTAGTYTLTFSSIAKNVNFTGFAGTFGSSVSLTVYGNFITSSGMTVAAGTSALTFGATSGTQEITTAGKTFDRPITFNGAGGTFKLLDNFTMGSTRLCTHTNGTLNLNGQTLTVGNAYTTGVGTKNLTFNGGTLVCPNSGATAFNNTNPTNYTTTAGTGTGKISMTSASAKTFVGNGSTFNCTLSNDGAGALTLTGSNTFTTLANGVQPTSFLFTAGTTTTLTNWNISGTAGNLVTIGSVTAASHTLSKSSGTVNADYLSISYSTATGGATWNAGANSVNGGNNSGWMFGYVVAGQFFQLFY